MAISTILPVYNRSNIVFEYGEGMYLYSIDGKKYLDFASGIGVNSLGHSNTQIINILKKQSEKLWHVSNSHETSIMKKFAKNLVDNSFADTVFFVNSGAEAVENAIKIARHYQYSKGNHDKKRIITFTGGYHGRTMANVSAGDKGKQSPEFAPYLEGFDIVEFNNIAAVKAAINQNTGAILVEPIQGNGGICVASKEFMQDLRKLCTEKGLLLILDEVQCGVGRTGKLFDHEYSGVKPDIMAIAKGIANGFPIGIVLMTEEVGSKVSKNSLGTTFGGNALAMAVGNAVLNVISDKKFLSNVVDCGNVLFKKLKEIQEKYPDVIEEVRGRGLFLGLKMGKHVNNLDTVSKFRDIGLLTVGSTNNVIRIMPPLIVEESHINDACEKIKTICKVLSAVQAL